MSDNQLILFVTGDAPRSRRARHNLAGALDQLRASELVTQEVDVIQEPQKALESGVFATPALALITADDRWQFLYGDLSDEASLQDFLATLTTPSRLG